MGDFFRCFSQVLKDYKQDAVPGYFLKSQSDPMARGTGELNIMVNEASH